MTKDMLYLLIRLERDKIKQGVKMNRGRKKGSKNKPKEIKEFSQEIKKIKKEIKDLKAEKLRLPAGDKVRIELGHKIKELKQSLVDKKEIKEQIVTEAGDKVGIIEEIKRLDLEIEKYGIDLYKFTIKQLKYHLERIKKVSP